MLVCAPLNHVSIKCTDGCRYSSLFRRQTTRDGRDSRDISFIDCVVLRDFRAYKQDEQAIVTSRTDYISKHPACKFEDIDLMVKFDYTCIPRKQTLISYDEVSMALDEGLDDELLDELRAGVSSDEELIYSLVPYLNETVFPRVLRVRVAART